MGGEVEWCHRTHADKEPGSLFVLTSTPDLLSHVSAADDSVDSHPCLESVILVAVELCVGRTVRVCRVAPRSG